MDEQQIQHLVSEVCAELSKNSPKSNGTSSGLVPARPSEQDGVYESIDQAAKSAQEAFQALKEHSLEQREKYISVLRDVGLKFKERWARLTVEETGMGRESHKIQKFEAVCKGTRGTEDLTTWAQSGDHGLTIEELAPYGVIGAVTPSTHPVPTLINNAISFLAGGNTAVFNPHPASRKVFAEAIATFNHALKDAGAPGNLLTTIHEPTIESAQQMFHHPLTRILLVTGGPGVVEAALKVPKKSITAGPGNPPVIIDETADIQKAARALVDGAGFDNNILCIGEKEVFCHDDVCDQLLRELEAMNCVRLVESEINALAKEAFPEVNGRRSLNRNLVGRDASILAARIGYTNLGPEVPLLVGEVKDSSHPWVQEEQLMPFLPVVRVSNVEEAIQLALQAEHGFRHTACMHSTSLPNLSRMARLCDCSIFVKNGPSIAGLAVGGEGYISYSIASPTGEGITTARNFTRKRRCTLVDAFRII